MADKFIATLSITDGRPPLNTIAEDLQSSDDYVVERKSNSETALRFAGKTRRVEWPADFTLAYLEEGLLVTIHGSL
jgi:hypothetical protein